MTAMILKEPPTAQGIHFIDLAQMSSRLVGEDQWVQVTLRSFSAGWFLSINAPGPDCCCGKLARPLGRAATRNEQFWNTAELESEMTEVDRRTFLQRAAALGLTVGTQAWSRALAAPIPETEVRGAVVSGKTPLAGVRVSEGLRVVRTDSAGEFSIRVGPDSGRFLFVTLPRGYWTDLFYLPTATAISRRPLFNLTDIGAARSNRLLYMTDVHLTEGNAQESVVRMNQTIDEINSLDPLPDACWVGGDISLDHLNGPLYVDLVSRLRMPVRHALGNHEFLLEQFDPRSRFHQLFGPTYYSFDLDTLHCITLDGCAIDPTLGESGGVIGRLGQQELKWLAADLAAVPEGMTSIVAIHIPLVSSFPERMGTTASKSPQWVVSNAEEAIELLRQNDVRMVLQGHLHENQRTVQSDIEFVESVSVCGTWWQAKAGQRENGTSGEPRGYRMFEWSGERLTHDYLGSAESRVAAVGEIVGRPQRLPGNREEELLVNVFDGSNMTEVSAQIDDGPLQSLRPTNRGRHFGDLQANHHWAWKIPALALTQGQHRLLVRVEEPGRPRQIFSHHFSV